MVGQVVPGHRGDHGVRQPHLDDRFGDPAWFVGVEGIGPSGVDQAEAAGPGTSLAVDHEGGRAVVPALGDVRTTGLLAHRGQTLLTHQRLQTSVAGAGVQRHPHPRRLAPHPTVNRNRNRSGPRSSTERAEVEPLPRRSGHVGPIHRAGRPLLGRTRRHTVHHLGHGHVDPLGRQGGHPELGDPARHHPVKVGQVGRHVQGEAVHGPAPGELHADGRHLAGPVPLGFHPHPRVPVQATHVGQAQVAAHRHHDLLHGPDVGRGVGHPATPLSRKVEQRVADQLAGSVIGDVAAPVGLHHLGTDLGRRSQQVIQAGPQPERVDGVVLQQKQVVLGRSRRPGVDPLLEGQGIAVADPPQPSDPERPIGSGWIVRDRAHRPAPATQPAAQREAQSAPSSVRFIVRRKAAA